MNCDGILMAVHPVMSSLVMLLCTKPKVMFRLEQHSPLIMFKEASVSAQDFAVVGSFMLLCNVVSCKEAWNFTSCYLKVKLVAL